ncbi:aminopeptidase [Caloranaerobacter azorensis H53214]|uniref:Probable M18 family aminopeptidase 2 n=2 Tax=Caloranaerobacter azorensis TaxID=116090 RepID=A0A1M5URD3_9FIRM|nr:M18 family aminopeptidase [Caloranaerobacter azorensis]KGG80049.1 aminopeptidase [Caloranaerobacter azorensis H53214]SHH65632.1 aspartyl aminopeptidase [Caloranaerobacter azorensis DSM 13643]
MEKELRLAQELIDFIYKSPTQYHAVESIKEMLINSGFEELKLRDKWNIEKGGKYFVTKNDSALVAFVVGRGDIEKDGFKLIGAHTDAPTFRIKPSPEMIAENSYLKLNTEVYGGPILNTWFDRPLSLAGRVSLKSDNPLYPETRLININEPILIIPNLAIHMNRKINEGVSINKQKDVLPILSLINDEFEKDNYLIKLLSKHLNVNYEDIIDFDLYLYEFEKGKIIGLNREFISCGRLDDLAMVHAGITALINSEVSNSTNVMVCFDNEEVGSQTKQGAGSPMLINILERIVYALGKDKEDFFRAIYSSFLISADMAHAVHPNSPEKHDPVNKPKINKGPVIKINANLAYTTDSDSCAVYEMICKMAGIPLQKFVNRSDERGGSTIGPISSSQLDIRSIDIGNPMLAMHSIRELAGVLDHYYVTKSFEKYFSL